MAACKFIIPFSGEVNSILLKAKNAVESQDGNFNGDESTGNFNVSVLGSIINGSYSVSGHHLNIVIESKSFFIPCSAIESFLKKKIEG
ncbi:MAG: hypothetical protein ABIN97_03320 [Ginsengibacter sp.]